VEGRSITNPIAVFLSNYTIDSSPSIINFLELLSDNYTVDLYLLQMRHKAGKILRKPSVRVVFDGDGLRWPTVLKLVKKAPLYKGTICFDPHGLELCKRLFPAARPVYYSLELYLKNDHTGLDYPPFLMKRERRDIHSISGLIIQSEEKEALFREDYRLEEKIPGFILPVTYQGPAIEKKESLLRQKYHIPPDKKIALHLGGIAAWFSCLEIALVFSQLEDWVLIFQGMADHSYLEDMKKGLAEFGARNVIFSDHVYTDMDDVIRVVASADLGIAWYNNISAGFRTAGKSSGKIAAYFKAGLPVVAKRYRSTGEAIERTGSGVCVESVDQIPWAVQKIEAAYERFSHSALAEYERSYRFENYGPELVKFLSGAFSTPHGAKQGNKLKQIFLAGLEMAANKMRT
jgi:glycosyltransferase involved in cell wall biosynthesis